MKKEVVLLLFLIILMPIASADNFLTGRSIIGDIGNFFGNSVDFFKSLFTKDEVAVRNVNINNVGEENDAQLSNQVSLVCTENAVRCNTGSECSGSPCVMQCQNNQWVQSQSCREACSDGQCIESGTDLDVSSSGIGSGSGDIGQEKIHLGCRNNACVKISGEGENKCAANNDCIEQDIPAPTNLQYEITDQNTVILTWNNVLGGNSAIDGTGAITGYAVSENNNFINKIAEFIKSLFKKGPIGVLEKKYAIYKIKNVEGRNVVEKIAEINKNDCNDNLCNYEYATPSEGDYYVVKSKINDVESSSSNRVGPIDLVICGDGVIEGNEQCDGSNLNDKTCQFLGFSSGVLSCNNDCTFNTRRCQELGNTCEDSGRIYQVGQAQEKICYTGIGACQKQGIQTRTCHAIDEVIIRGWSEWSQCSAVPGQPIEVSERTCNDNLDNDCDGLTDALDDNCQENNQQKCNDNIDNDGDQIVDNLDIDCKSHRIIDNLKIKAIKLSAKEVYSNSNIIIEGYYEIPGRTSQEVSICTNLTLNNIDMNCQQKSPQQGFIRYANCNVGSEGLNKIINFSAIERCNFDPIFMFNRTYINATEFTTCENGQISTELLNELNIIEPDNNDEFEPGERISVEVKVKNSADEDQEIAVSASLLDEEYEEIETSDSAKQNILKLRDKIFIFNLTIPEDISEGNYKLYVKAYKYSDEEEVCKSSKINIRINEQDNPSDECSNNNDCRRGFVCERSECRSLSCNIPLILSPDGHSCITQTTGQGQGGQQGDAGNEGERRQTEDSDNDGLPDYWEYNFFGDLSQSPNDDFDNDGISNINEYINNTNPKVADNKKSSPIWTILIIIVILGIITLAVIFAIKKIKNKSGYNFSSRGYDLDNTNKSKIQLFVQQAKSQGMKKDEIKKSLLNAGWKEEDINKFL